jgi:flagella basal body P-ring formation protein FlgA
LKNITLHHTLQLGLMAMLLALVAERTSAAEIVLRAEARPTGTVVRLGDIADVFTDEADVRRQLVELELFPTPTAGTKRYVRVREALDLLHARGVNLAVHRVSGQSAVEVSTGPLSAAELAPLSSLQERQATDAVRNLIVRYLTKQLPNENGWSLDFKLTEEQSRAILATPSKLVVSGGAAPWVGNQRFELTPTGNASTISVEATVTLPPAVVVAVRTIPKHTIVQPDDVELQRGIKSSKPASELIMRIEDIVGRETTRTIVAGQYLEEDHVRQPLSIRRGDIVTVYARNSGLRVRTTARAKDDGSLGDLIAIESLLNKQTFFARVTGIQEVEVYAHGIDASGKTDARNMASGIAAAQNAQESQQSNVAARLRTVGETK